MPKIVSVVPHENHTLSIQLDNHHQIICDMRPRLQALRFRGLADLDRFKAIHDGVQDMALVLTKYTPTVPPGD